MKYKNHHKKRLKKNSSLNLAFFDFNRLNKFIQKQSMEINKENNNINQQKLELNIQNENLRQLNKDFKIGYQSIKDSISSLPVQLS